MATKPDLPAPPRAVTLKDNNLVLALGLVENGIIEAVNDSFVREKGSYELQFYAKKIEGKSVIKNYGEMDFVDSADQAFGGGKGFHIYKDPRVGIADRSHKICAFANKIFLTISSHSSLLRDVTDDGYILKFMSAVQFKKYSYIAIGESTQSAKLYRYDGAVKNTGTITSVADNGSGKARILFSATHNLNIGDYVKIEGSNSYDGEYSTKDVSDTTHIDIDKDFAATSTGTFEGNPLLIEVGETTMEASHILGKMRDRMISGAIADGTKILYSKSENDGDFDDFTAGIKTVDGGQLSGTDDSVTATAYYKGTTAIFGENSVTFHSIKPPLYTGGALLEDLGKDANTLIEGVTLDNKGVSNQRAVCTGRDAIFFADPRGAIFMYNTSLNPAIKELSASFQGELTKYDLKNSSICYDPLRDALYVTASSVADIANDVIFIYSFKSKGWSTDVDKRCGHLIYDDYEQKVYGLSSIEPKLFEVFDGTYTNEGNPIKITVYTRAYNSGDNSLLKEYENSSFEAGFVDATKEFIYNVYTNNNPSAKISETVDVSDEIFIPTEVAAQSPWGDGIFAGGWARETGMVFKNHFNEKNGGEFKKIVQMVSEESSSPFLVGRFKIVALPTGDETDEV